MKRCRPGQAGSRLACPQRKLWRGLRALAHQEAFRAGLEAPVLGIETVETHRAPFVHPGVGITTGGMTTWLRVGYNRPISAQRN